jgi:hypothetical protein
MMLESDQGGEGTTGSIPSLRELIGVAGGIAAGLGEYAIEGNECGLESTYQLEDESIRS